MKYLAKFIIGLTVLLSFYGCESDDYRSDLENTKELFSIETVYSKDILSNTSLRYVLDKVQKKKPKYNSEASKEVYNDLYDFYIETDEALYIEHEDYHSYTFTVYSR